MEAIFFKTDLHIHTPSSKCYKGNKDEEEYLKILESALKKNLKIIAITDHNTIAGYKKLIQIKEKLYSDKFACEKKSDPTQIKKLKTINKRIKYFEDLIIFPGVEFEVSNCVHILIIFNNNTPIEKIEEFLLLGGYDIDQQGLEISTKLSNWSILNLFDESQKYDCILIDAHTDSDKGIFNTIPQGRLRAACFSSEHLNGICYNSEKQKDNIDKILNTAPEYKRNSPLAYLKYSDSHRAEDVGSSKTWIKMDNLDFKSLKDAFKNPLERISTVQPKINEILTKIINLDTAFGIPDISDDSLEYFVKLVCALNNTRGGYCLFGLTKEKNKVGLKIDLKKKDKNDSVEDIVIFVQKILSSFKDVEDNNIPFKYDLKRNINIYPIENERFIITIYIKNSNYLINIRQNKIIYCVKNKNIVELNGHQIQDIVENRQVLNIEKKIYPKIKKIESECTLIKNYLSSIPILKKFEKSNIKLLDIIEPPKIPLVQKLSKANLIKYSELSKKYSNGVANGNFILFPDKYPPRFGYAYLRYSIPILKINIKKKITKKETIYLIEGGAIHLSNYIYHICSQDSLNCIYFNAKNTKDYSNKFIASFLKSSFWLWYCINVFEKTDFSEEPTEIVLPKINVKDSFIQKNLTNLHKYFDKIIKLEKQFLKNYEKNSKSKKLPEDKSFNILSKKIEEHNNAISPICYMIDKIIYSIVGLTQNEINTIETCIRESNIYIHDESN